MRALTCFPVLAASVMYACIAMEITKKIAKCDTTHVGMSSKDVINDTLYSVGPGVGCAV